MSTATIASRSIETNEATDRLTETLEEKLSHPATSPDFDLHAETNEVLKDIGLTTADSGGKVSFYGPDPSELYSLRHGGRDRFGCTQPCPLGALAINDR
jgi:hypothetical protein